MFRGQYEHAIDAKGRTSVPARVRDQLAPADDPRFILAPSPTDACLHAYPLKAWEAIEAQIAALPKFDDDALRLRRTFISAAVDCDVDRVGRVLIPGSMRAYAGLSKGVRWAGMGQHLEIWSEENWARTTTLGPEEAAAFRRALAEKLRL